MIGGNSLVNTWDFHEIEDFSDAFYILSKGARNTLCGPDSLLHITNDRVVLFVVRPLHSVIAIALVFMAKTLQRLRISRFRTPTRYYLFFRDAPQMKSAMLSIDSNTIGIVATN